MSTGEASEPELLVETRGRTLVMTLNRPQARNAINYSLSTQIQAAIEQLDSRDDLSVGVLTGNGPAFSAGMDLKAFAAGERPVVEGAGFAGLVQRRPDKPLIAAVDGFALAGGFEIVLSCDLVVASQRSLFGVPEVRRGLCAGGGGLFRLRERLPYNVALELLLTGDTLTAAEAHTYGLVNRLTEDGEALTSALELAAKLEQNAPLAMAASKRVFMESSAWTDAESFTRQEAYISAVRDSNDAREGAIAFAEKRDPVWTNS